MVDDLDMLCNFLTTYVYISSIIKAAKIVIMIGLFRRWTKSVDSMRIHALCGLPSPYIVQVCFQHIITTSNLLLGLQGIVHI